MGSVLVLSVSLSRGLAADPEGAADLTPADTLLNEPLHLLHGRRCVQPQISEMEIRGRRDGGMSGFRTPLR